VLLSFGNGNGTFQAPVSVAVGERDVHSIGVADLDHDGHLDLTAISDRSPKQLTVRLGRGDGSFDPMQTYNISFFFNQYTPGGTTEIIDVNGDALEDILFASTDAQDFSLWLNNGDGTFADHQRIGVGHEVYDMKVRDFDGDGTIDVAMSTQIDDGQWFHSGAVIIRGMVSEVLLGDINLDGRVNLSDIAPFVNLVTSGTFQAEADINGDGSVDLLDVSGFVSLLSGK
jgi:hypothetical protein